MKTMKRIVAWILALAMVMSLAACGKPASKDDEQDLLLVEQTSAPEETVVEAETTAATETTAPEEETTEATTAPTEESKATQPTTSGNNGNNGQNSGNNTTEPTKATEPAETTAPTEATEPAETTVPTEETEPAETTAPTEETEPAETTEPTEEPTEPDENNPGSTEETTEPTEPNEDNTEETEPAEDDDQSITPVAPTSDYNPGTVLVKVKDGFKAEDLGTLAYTNAEPLYNGSKWYTVELSDVDKTEEAVAYLTSLNTFAQVDYDYIMATDVTATSNPDYSKHAHHHTHKVPDSWGHAENNGKNPGGSKDVIVAVIDTGVDYQHMDLRNNIWYNAAEIPNNGRDDDGNGYIDDVYGWDFVGNDADPMDDNGHGTHVAGIIAAENNELGGVGIAYNCKVMVLKAGNSSGYFNNSDIAEAIQYAYMNGASVINMSFGGSSVSIAVEEVLESAYNSCILVAAAGNDGACNNLACKKCDVKKVTYPAAFSFVIGVMSTTTDGQTVSSFSNYDHYPYNSVEYEVYAVGEAVPSCWPNNKYATLNGTSMATPTVSAIAALLRSYYADRQVYSTKFIQSQIVNTGTVNPANLVLNMTDDAHTVTDGYQALTCLPKPDVKLYDYSIDDSTSISAKNNGNGVINAGETVRLYVSLQNRGGVASDVQVSIDANRDEGMSDPYFTFLNPTMELSDIGTYSIRESGDQYFEIQVSQDCPNDYLVNFNIRYTYTNGLDEQDETVYEDDGRQQAQFNVSSGYHLPSVIDEDTVFTNDRLYIVSENVLIAEGVTVTFQEGCRIQFYSDKTYYDSPVVSVYGTLKLEGTKENMIEIYPSERYTKLACIIKDYGTTTIDYVEAMNLFVSGVDAITNSSLRHSSDWVKYYNDAELEDTHSLPDISATVCRNNYIELISYATELDATTLDQNYIVIASSNSCTLNATSVTNNLIYSVIKGECKVSDRMNSFTGEVSNNKFLCEDSGNPVSLMGFKFSKKDLVKDNYFDPGYHAYADQIISGYYNSNGSPTVDINTSCSDISALWPHVTNVEIFNADGEQTLLVGKEKITVRVTFNRPMDQNRNTNLTFGTIAPYADYKIEGSFVSETVWEGQYTLKAQIENGQNFLKVNNACAAEDKTKTLRGENQLFEFTIDTTAALAMNLFAVATENGIELTWNQDDYATLMGYNIYRADSKDGNYVKINPSVLLASESSFLDDNAEPGKTYWYTFTVVLSDFSESAPAGKVSCVAVDTLNPTIYHTPVNQGYENNNLVISCTASDNMRIESVTLYYREKGASDWKSLKMSSVNDKYSATIFGNDLTQAGLEYYIVATDGVNSVTKGTEEEPYSVVIKDASSIIRVGDVDGNGTVTTLDALMLMQCLSGDLLLSDDAFKRADLNGDNELSSAEALRILQYVNGKVPNLDM